MSHCSARFLLTRARGSSCLKTGVQEGSAGKELLGPPHCRQHILGKDRKPGASVTVAVIKQCLQCPNQCTQIRKNELTNISYEETESLYLQIM